jgi:hypothetical protein
MKVAAHNMDDVRAIPAGSDGGGMSLIGGSGGDLGGPGIITFNIWPSRAKLSTLSSFLATGNRSSSSETLLSKGGPG